MRAAEAGRAAPRYCPSSTKNPIVSGMGLCTNTDVYAKVSFAKAAMSNPPGERTVSATDDLWRWLAPVMPIASGAL